MNGGFIVILYREVGFSSMKFGNISWGNIAAILGFNRISTDPSRQQGERVREEGTRHKGQE